MLLVPLLAAVGGCHELASFVGGDAGDPGVRDATLDVDLRPRADVPRDGIRDAADALVDVGIVDAADATADALADVTRDGNQTTLELTVDVTDGPPPTPPCNGSLPNVGVAETYRSDMVICRDASGVQRLTQCTAEKLCNVPGGWHMCAASEFLARGGRNKPTPRQGWIQGCVRNGGSVSAPADNTCSSCAPNTGQPQQALWTCSGGVSGPMADALYVGLQSWSGCARPGANVTQWDGAWTTRATSGMLTAAVCCY
ncbi:MAG: hypothetical protein KC503_19330 [Myxococcales bacterium]|nr:hypothetical protein [Myxococcales bacterium]